MLKFENKSAQMSVWLKLAFFDAVSFYIFFEKLSCDRTIIMRYCAWTSRYKKNNQMLKNGGCIFPNYFVFYLFYLNVNYKINIHSCRKETTFLLLI
jgi:hypothetical protein